jgi:hypothetical protein
MAARLFNKRCLFSGLGSTLPLRKIKRGKVPEVKNKSAKHQVKGTKQNQS